MSDALLRRRINSKDPRYGKGRKWVQRPPKASWLHFDIAKSKRALAIAAGAIETDRYGPSLHVARLRGNQEMIDRIERLRARGTAEATSGGDGEPGRT